MLRLLLLVLSLAGPLSAAVTLDHLIEAAIVEAGLDPRAPDSRPMPLSRPSSGRWPFSLTWQSRCAIGLPGCC
jgi:hypothetical protein